MTAPETTTIRIRRPDSERLNQIARARSMTVIELVHLAIDALDRQEFLTELEEGYRRLRANPELWAEYQAENRLLGS